MTKEYKKLHKYEEYDQGAAEELAEVVMEIMEIEKRREYLKELLHENRELQQFLWTTAEGKTLAYHQIPDDHFANILQHVVNHGRRISKAMKAEARKRGMTIPENPKIAAIAQAAAEYYLADGAKEDVATEEGYFDHEDRY